ncbi:hypothetical protein H8356DRAFT_1323915 [Neocallimastix lanati (nom. inval.)]|nr:hypothetical protein H8356DRAFT_1323915 [Neocallimastix sp. JGI-2020a]
MQLGEIQLGEMQHFNTTPLGEMQSGEIQFGKCNSPARTKFYGKALGEVVTSIKFSSDYLNISTALRGVRIFNKDCYSDRGNNADNTDNASEGEDYNFFQIDHSNPPKKKI